MRIAVLLINVDLNYAGGVTQFAKGISKGFSEIATSTDSVVFYVTDSNRSILENLIESPSVTIRVLRNSNKNRSLTHKIYQKISFRLKYFLPLELLSRKMYSGLIKEIEADADIVYTPYGPPPIFPYTRKAMVFSIHDIQHEYFPEFFTEEQLAERNYTFRTCTRNATLIQASSNQMKSNFLTTYTHLKDDQVFLAPEGVDLSFWSSPSDDSLQIGEIYRIPDRYIYLPAQLWKHKNHKTILFALFQLKKNGQAVHLVLSGARYSGADEIFRLIEDLDIKELVHYLGVIPIEHVRELMRKSVCVVSAALYESSSLPILETLAAGGRVLAGNTPPNIELSNKLNFDLFDNLSPESCADALLKIINSSSDIVSEINLSDFEWKNISKIYFKNFRNFSGVTNHV